MSTNKKEHDKLAYFSYSQLYWRHYILGIGASMLAERGEYSSLAFKKYNMKVYEH